MAVQAVQQIRRMRGGAQGHLMLCSDGELYVVKFPNNPQHVRVLANEFLASRLAKAVGLSVPSVEIVDVSSWLIENTSELTVELKDGAIPCLGGLCFGSKFIGGLLPGQTVDYLPEEQLRDVKNLNEFCGMLAIDKWTCNSNGRQAVFYKRPKERKYKATFIDQGYCFNAGEWIYEDAPLRGVYARNLVYRHVAGWVDFCPWLEQIENFPAEVAWSIAEVVPPDWYGGDISELEVLIEKLLVRRSIVRDLILQFRNSDRNPFPDWGSSPGDVHEALFPELRWLETEY